LVIKRFYAMQYERNFKLEDKFARKLSKNKSAMKLKTILDEIEIGDGSTKFMQILFYEELKKLNLGEYLIERGDLKPLGTTKYLNKQMKYFSKYCIDFGVKTKLDVQEILDDLSEILLPDDGTIIFSE
jgi:hypothetical protein